MKKYLSSGIKFFVCIAAMLVWSDASAQKKVVPVTQSAITAISLPNGSKKDSRMLTEIAAKAILQMEAKKSGASVSSIEVLYLTETFNNDSLNQACSASGWAVTPSATDKEYLWLQKDGRSVLAYFSPSKKQPELYFGESSGGGQQTTTTTDAGTQTQNTGQQTGTQQQNDSTQQTNVQQQTEQKPATQEISQPATGSGYAFSTTNFDNGWVSKIYDDYVEVTKGNIKVLLGYRERFNESDYSGTGKEKGITYWNSFVGKYFNLGEAIIRQRTTFSDY